MLFADLSLARRLERAEGHASAQFAEARARLFPGTGACWMECAGGYAIFDGIDSPVTQTFGLGLFEELTRPALDTLERFFLERGAPVLHEICPLAGVAALTLLCDSGYRPVEISSVLYRAVKDPPAAAPANIRVRPIGPDEVSLWNEVSTRAWSHDHPELKSFLEQMSALLAQRHGSVSFLAEIDGRPGAAGALVIQEGVALFAGAATVPELRCRGLQSALLEERMRYAFHHGCEIAMMAAEAGSDSQRNAERKGFGVAYTRTKWSLGPR